MTALSDSPVLFLQGPRQVGKTTLVRSLTDGSSPRKYLTLDQAAVLSAAQADPDGFLAGIQGPIIIDEVQRAPELLYAVKAEVDLNRRPGRFLLTGSANVLLTPQVSDALAGRVEFLPLWPLSQGEIDGVRETWLADLLAGNLQPRSGTASRAEVFDRVARGGFPEAVDRKDPARRASWFDSYVATLVQRDIRDLSEIDGLTEMPQLLAILAHRAGGLVNYADISRVSGIPQTTLKRYMALLHGAFLIQMIPAWAQNRGKRLVKSPKVYLHDTGLLCHLMGGVDLTLGADPRPIGQTLENFVLLELQKQASFDSIRIGIHHFRTPAGAEVDFVLEDRKGKLFGIEVKAAATVRATDFRGLHALAEMAPDKFQFGIVLHTGLDTIPFGRNMWAMPVSSLWQ